MNENLALQSIFVLLASDFLHAVKCYDMGPPVLLPLRKKESCGFHGPEKSIALGLYPRTMGPMASTLTITPPRCLQHIDDDKRCAIV
jgi:hypothetical protein